MPKDRPKPKSSTSKQSAAKRKTTAKKASGKKTPPAKRAAPAKKPPATPSSLTQAKQERDRLRKALSDQNATYEAVTKAAHRAQALIDRLSKGTPSAGEKELIKQLRRDKTNLLKRKEALAAKRKQETGWLRRVKQWIRRHTKSKKGTVLMQDSIDPANIAPGPALCYTTGLWPTCTVMSKQPDKWHPLLPTSIRKGAPGKLRDVEPGDWSNAESAGEHGGMDYTSIGNMAPLWNAIAATGEDPSDRIYITAHYNDKDHICDETCYPGITKEMAACIRGTQFHSDDQKDVSRVHLDVFG